MRGQSAGRGCLSAGRPCFLILSPEQRSASRSSLGCDPSKTKGAGMVAETIPAPAAWRRPFLEIPARYVERSVQTRRETNRLTSSAASVIATHGRRTR